MDIVFEKNPSAKSIEQFSCSVGLEKFNVANEY